MTPEKGFFLGIFIVFLIFITFRLTANYSNVLKDVYDPIFCNFSVKNSSSTTTNNSTN